MYNVHSVDTVPVLYYYVILCYIYTLQCTMYNAQKYTSTWEFSKLLTMYFAVRLPFINRTSI